MSECDGSFPLALSVAKGFFVFALMNAYESSALGLAQLQAELVQPMTGRSAGMTAKYKGTTVPAIVSPFMLLGRLTEGGFSPSVESYVVILKKDAPSDWNLKTGQQMTVVGADGLTHDCKIQNLDDQFGCWNVQVQDHNQGA